MLPRSELGEESVVDPRQVDRCSIRQFDLIAAIDNRFRLNGVGRPTLGIFIATEGDYVAIRQAEDRRCASRMTRQECVGVWPGAAHDCR